MLHVVSGDGAARHVSDLNVGGDVVAWREALSTGPVSAPLDLAARAAFLGTSEEQLASQNQLVLDGLDDGPVVLWFGRDVFCQLNLAGLIAWLDAAGATGELHLVQPAGPPRCLDDTDDALRSWFADRVPLGADERAAITALWEAYADGDRQTIESALAAHPRTAVSDGVRRHLDTLPGDDGFGCDERTILDIARVEGGVTFGELFRQFTATHPELGWGDLQVSALVDGLKARGQLTGDKRLQTA